MEKPVFHWLLNAASTHYADDIVYTEDAPFTQTNKKALRDFIRHRLLELSLGRDETKDVEFDTSKGAVRIHVALHPEWQRYKTIEGFLEIEEPHVVEAAPPMPVAALTVEKSQQMQGLKKFTILLESGYTEFEAMYKEEQEDRYVFYDADGAILTFFCKSLGVLAIITNGTFVQLPGKSVKRLLKGLIGKSR